MGLRFSPCLLHQNQRWSLAFVQESITRGLRFSPCLQHHKQRWRSLAFVQESVSMGLRFSPCLQHQKQRWRSLAFDFHASFLTLYPLGPRREEMSLPSCSRTLQTQLAYVLENKETHGNNNNRKKENIKEQSQEIKDREKKTESCQSGLCNAERNTKGINQ